MHEPCDTKHRATKFESHSAIADNKRIDNTRMTNVHWNPNSKQPMLKTIGTVAISYL